MSLSTWSAPRFLWIILIWNFALLIYIFGSHLIIGATTGEGRILGIIFAAVFFGLSNAILMTVRCCVLRRDRHKF